MKTLTKLKTLLQKPSLAFEKYHQSTKIKKLGPMDDPKDWPKSWKTVYFKDYPRLDKIILPDPASLNNTLLEDVFMKRKSSRSFSKKPLTLEQLSNLLYYSAGLRDNKFPYLANRFYPSPGARYPLEVYLISQNSDLPVSLYHYNVRSHSLEILLTMRHFRYLRYFNQDWIAKASCIVLITAVFERNTMKYGDRGYRQIMQEAGHLGQNFYLISTALDIGICGIGAYPDDKINKLLGIDGVRETVVYVLAIGN